MKIHPYVHISENKSKYFFIPELLNNNIKGAKYLSNIKIIPEVKQVKENNKTFGINDKINIEQGIYLNNKIINVDYAFDIIFSEYSELNYLNDNFIKHYNLNKDKFKNDISNITELYSTIFKLDFSSISVKKNFEDDIDEIKENISEFISNAIIPIKEYYNSLLTKKMKIEINDKDIISKINNFLVSYFNKCYFTFKDLNKLYNDNGMITVLYLNSKLYILEEFEEMFKNQKIQLDKILSKKRNEYILNAEKIIKNLNNFQKLVKMENYMEDEYNYYNEWISLVKTKYWKFSYKNYKALFDIQYIKQLLKDIVININLKMNYTYDGNFCLWAIENGFIEYFY